MPIPQDIARELTSAGLKFDTDFDRQEWDYYKNDTHAIADTWELKLVSGQPGHGRPIDIELAVFASSVPEAQVLLDGGWKWMAFHMDALAFTPENFAEGIRKSGHYEDVERYKKDCPDISDEEARKRLEADQAASMSYFAGTESHLVLSQPLQEPTELQKMLVAQEEQAQAALPEEQRRNIMLRLLTENDGPFLTAVISSTLKRDEQDERGLFVEHKHHDHTTLIDRPQDAGRNHAGGKFPNSDYIDEEVWQAATGLYDKLHAIATAAMGVMVAEQVVTEAQAAKAEIA